MCKENQITRFCTTVPIDILLFILLSLSKLSEYRGNVETVTLSIAQFLFLTRCLSLSPFDFSSMSKNSV